MSGKPPRRGRGAGGPPGGGGQGGPKRGLFSGNETRGGGRLVFGRGSSDGGGGRGGFNQGGDGGRGGRGGGGRGGGGVIDNRTVYTQEGGVPTPDTKVQSAEDQTLKALRSGGNGLKPPPNQVSTWRPSYGTKGMPVTLWANYMKLMPTGDQTLFRYSVDIEKGKNDKKPVGKKSGRIIELLLEENFSQVKDTIATDYRSTLIASSEIPLSDQPYRVTYREEGASEAREYAITHRISVKKTGTLTVSDLLNYLTSTNAGAILESKDEVIQALNIVVGNYPKSNPGILSVGANRHYPFEGGLCEKRPLGVGLEAMRGFFVSVRAATARLLVNVQVKHTACYEPVRLDVLMRSFCNVHGFNNLFELERFIKLLRVRLPHLTKKGKDGKGIPKTVTILGLATPNDGRELEKPPLVSKYGSGANKVQFFYNPQAGSAGEYITIEAFFKRMYNIVIENPDIPVLKTGSLERPAYLPAQVCMVEPGQLSKAKLSPQQTGQMIKFAVRTPDLNAQCIVENGAKVLGVSPQLNSCLKSFGLSIIPKLITVPGRVLQPPPLKYKTNGAQTRDGGWNMSNLQFSKPTRLPAWSYLWLCSGYSREDVWQSEESLRGTLEEFRREMTARGINCESSFSHCGVRVPKLTKENLHVEIEKAFEKVIGLPEKPRLLLVILPRTDTAIYNRVKFLGDVKTGIHTVCVVGSKLARRAPRSNGPDVQYFANVALKFNLKLGGANQLLDPGRLNVISGKKTMVVGLDVTHPSPGSSPNAPSVAGIVASVDSTLAQWPAAIRIQASKQEMVSALDELLKSRLKLWRGRNNNALPENILVYRDGISEGQYKITLEKEVPLLRKACEEVYSAPETKKGLPRISLIVVGKRHNTRFYQTKKEDADKHSNPQNGTIVDRGVTEARNWEFFLQAHTALHGTARPAHYYVVLDEIFRTGTGRTVVNAADDLEELTHNMCYLFGRATKAVSVCPPAYYADLVCERARCYLSGLFDGSSTPTGSVAGGGGGGQQLNAADVVIHELLKDSMFYL